MRSTLASSVNFRFTIKHPTSGRTSFKIEKRTFDPISKKLLKSETIESNALNVINIDFKAGKITADMAHSYLKDLVASLYKEAKALRAVVYNSDNLKILDRYWEAEYSYRELIDSATARYELERAVEAIGSLSLYSAKREELQTAIDKCKLPPNKQRRIVSKLMQIFKFLGRHDIRLRKAKRAKLPVRHISEAEFRLMLSHITSEPIRVLHEVAFYTGARIGEIFALEPMHFNEDKLELKILTQIDKHQNERNTKNRVERTTIVFPNGVSALTQWFTLKSEVDPAARKNIASVTKKACRQAFPDQSKKHLRFHDLRHCYAIMARERGLSTEDVADMLGNSLLVCKEHYTGFGPTTMIMDTRRNAIKKAI